ncbi:MAG TPA: ABC transporter ATP-binding protein [bacterium]|nr:ABC transporter ATP-binding protein [bacterium]HPN93117.1 ABC transporter ATP-binding protein [bacterium]
MLKVKSVRAGYGAIRALKGVSFHVNEGEIVTLIGANGAGKSTLLNTISGLVRATAGEILLKDKPIHKMTPAQIVRQGISQSPEGRQVFASLSVRDNLILGAYPRMRNSTRAEIAQDLEHVEQLFPILKERDRQSAGTLSGGEQQMLAIGRSLMAKPRILLLDEPTMGLAPIITAEILKTVRRLRDEEGVTIVLIEQNARAALSIADRGYVLETGRVSLEGKVEELLENSEVKRAYLGKGYKEVWE